MADPQESYHAFVDGDPAYRLPQADALGEPGRYVIEDDSQANWALGKLQALARDNAKRAQFLAQERAKLDAWDAQESGRAARDEAYFMGLLEAYYQRLRAAGVVTNRRKRYTLPNGTLRSRARPVTWRRDDAVLLPWARAAGLVRTKEEVDWGALKARLQAIETTTEAGVAQALPIDTETGEVVPGLTVETMSGETFSVEPAEG